MSVNQSAPVAAADLDVAALQHRAAILDLMYAYACCVDRRNYAALTDVFTAEGVLQGPQFKMSGCAEIEAALKMNEQYDVTHHNVFNHRVVIDGDTATAETYCVAYHLKHSASPATRMDMGIRYQDQLVLESGRWKIAVRHLDVDWVKDSAL